MAPARTETTTSSVSSSVIRRPSTCRFSIPARFKRRVDLLAAAVHDDDAGGFPSDDACERRDDRLEPSRLLEQLAA